MSHKPDPVVVATDIADDVAEDGAGVIESRTGRPAWGRLADQSSSADADRRTTLLQPAGNGGAGPDGGLASELRSLAGLISTGGHGDRGGAGPRSDRASPVIERAPPATDAESSEVSSGLAARGLRAVEGGLALADRLVTEVTRSAGPDRAGLLSIGGRGQVPGWEGLWGVAGHGQGGKGRHAQRWERSYDDSPERTDAVLNGRIAVAIGDERLAAERKAVEAGTGDRAAYEQHARDHDALTQQVETQAAELSPQRSALIADVIEGHQRLDGYKAALDQERTRLDAALQQQHTNLQAGRLDLGGYVRNAMDTGAYLYDRAQYEAVREDVYADTEELRAATGRAARAPPSTSSSGSAASCVASGVFTECDAVSGAGWSTETDRCMGLAGISDCSVAAGSGDRAASGECSADGCSTTASHTANTASWSCAADGCETASVADVEIALGSCTAMGGCTGATATSGAAGVSAGAGKCVGGCALEAGSDIAGDASVDCTADSGSCVTSSVGSARETLTSRQNSLAGRFGPSDTSEPRSAAATSHCDSSAGSCGTWSSAAGGDSTDPTGSSEAGADVDCAGIAGCTGSGATTTSSGTASPAAAGSRAERSSTGLSGCRVSSGSCRTGSSAGAGNLTGPDRVRDLAGWLVDRGDAVSAAAAPTDGESTADSAATSHVNCAGTPGCAGSGYSLTSATGVGAPQAGRSAPVRETTGASSCDVAAADCASQSRSQSTDDTVEIRTSQGSAQLDPPGPPATRDGGRLEMAASSAADATATCQVVGCSGGGASATSSAASGDVPYLDSTGRTSCAARGVGNDCRAHTETAVADRSKPVTTVGDQVLREPIGNSRSAAFNRCAPRASGDCAGAAASETNALDTGMSPRRRGSNSTASCTVTGGGCTGSTVSAASTHPDYAVYDAATEQPAAVQPTSGPTGNSQARAVLDCPQPCAGNTVEEMNNGVGNRGDGNNGDYNVGHLNTGDHNVGNFNVGNDNVGNRNVGHWNVGEENRGSHNRGDRNDGDRNRGSGNRGNANFGDNNRGTNNRGSNNVGHSNTGNSNRGSNNTGNSNRGSNNVGHSNTGNSNRGSNNWGNGNRGNGNVGNHNLGNRNRGNENVGKSNVGNYNVGNYNVGDSNIGNGNRGNGNVGNSNIGNHNRGDDNRGNGNQGNDNIGNDNQGDSNVGDGNVGNSNTGYGNTGNGNRGDDNIGNSNVGNSNIGNENVGNDNVGDGNTGIGNQGSHNVGNDNLGHRNVGNGNTGNGNRGEDNIGNENRGNDNIGDRNVGDRNVGDRNVGDRNTGNDHRGNDRGSGVDLGVSPTAIGVAHDLFNNYQRGIGTMRDAANRHQWEADHATDDTSRHRHLRLADHYNRRSARLQQISDAKFPKGVHGYFSDRIKNWSATTGADGINRTTNADGGRVPTRPGNPWQEYARRGLTKVAGAGTVIGTGVDIGVGFANGESAPHAVGRSGSTAVVGAAASGLATAGLTSAAAAAVVPGPGWAVAGGILVGSGAAILFEETGAADAIGDLAEDAWDGVTGIVD